MRLIGTWNPVSIYAFIVTGFVPHAFASVGGAALFDADAGTTSATTAAILTQQARPPQAPPASGRDLGAASPGRRRAPDGSCIHYSLPVT